jgi:hypothetical protein
MSGNPFRSIKPLFWIISLALICGVATYALCLAGRSPVRPGLSVKQVSAHLDALYARDSTRGESRFAPFGRMRDRMPPVRDCTVDSRGECTNLDEGLISVVTEFSLRRGHIFATRYDTIFFPLTNGVEGSVARVRSYWEWKWDL